MQGRHTIDLSWEGANADVDSIDIFLDGDSEPTMTVPNSGAYTDSTNNRGGGSYTYRVCEAGTDACSSEVTVTF